MAAADRTSKGRGGGALLTAAGWVKGLTVGTRKPAYGSQTEELDIGSVRVLSPPLTEGASLSASLTSKFIKLRPLELPAGEEVPTEFSVLGDADWTGSDRRFGDGRGICIRKVAGVKEQIGA